MRVRRVGGSAAAAALAARSRLRRPIASAAGGRARACDWLTSSAMIVPCKTAGGTGIIFVHVPQLPGSPKSTNSYRRLRSIHLSSCLMELLRAAVVDLPHVLQLTSCTVVSGRSTVPYHYHVPLTSMRIAEPSAASPAMSPGSEAPGLGWTARSSAPHFRQSHHAPAPYNVHRSYCTLLNAIV